MNEDRILRSRRQIISRLTEARLEKQMSQAELAALVGTQRSNICRMESGAQNVSLDMLIKVAGALGKDVNILLEERRSDMGNRYSLRLYDDEILAFTLEEKGLEGLKAHILSVNTEQRKLFPLDLEVTDDGVIQWLERRVIPKNRAFVDEILKTLGLSINNTKGIIDVCKGLSLNDSYWVVPSDFTGTFKEYNLYENRFSEVLSLVAYTGIGTAGQAFTTSPELTTQGMLRKAWRYIENDGIYLYKGGTEGFANSGKEPFSEYYACQIAKAMGLNAVAYDLENWKGILASKCKLFTNIDTSFISIGRIVKTGGIKGCLDYYSSLGEDFAESLKSMLIFDAVIYNEDRHFGNFGVLRDNHTGKIISPAPLFDHGLSLFNYAMDEDMKDLDTYAKTRSNPYGVSYENICAEVIGAKQKNQLRKLIGFRFTRHPSINLPEERLTAIEKHLQSRVRQLLALPISSK